MTRLLFWTGWLIVPLAALGLHYGLGQGAMQRDLAAEHARDARRAADSEDWSLAAVAYSVARSQWPEDSRNGRWRLELAEAGAQIRSGELIAGQEQLETLLEEMENDLSADATLRAAVRHDLATSSYYAAWIMRLEGAETDEWKQEAERARQQFRLLAEQADEIYGPGSTEKRTAQENLEATIRLEQMDLRTLMARPLPKNCCSNCNGLCQKKRKQSASRCKSSQEDDGKKKKGQQPDDARQEIKKTNSAGVFHGELEGS